MDVINRIRKNYLGSRLFLMNVCELNQEKEPQINAFSNESCRLNMDIKSQITLNNNSYNVFYKY